MGSQLESEQEKSARAAMAIRSQEEDLASAKHQLLGIQHQLTLAEKVATRDLSMQ